MCFPLLIWRSDFEYIRIHQSWLLRSKKVAKTQEFGRKYPVQSGKKGRGTLMDSHTSHPSTELHQSPQQEGKMGRALTPSLPTELGATTGRYAQCGAGVTTQAPGGMRLKLVGIFPLASPVHDPPIAVLG